MAPIAGLNLHDALSNLARQLQTTSLLAARNPNSTPTPTTTTTTLLTRILHAARDTTSLIPTGYGSINTGPAPGTVVGIVLGSVAGFLLILWLIYTCLNFGNMSGADTRSAYTESVVVPRERRKSRNGGSRRSRRTSEKSAPATRRPRPPSPHPHRARAVAQRTERIIVEERREERRAPSRRGSDEVVVIEEHSPPRRKKSHREREVREVREEERRDSGFRTVDPMAYGGVVGGNERRGSRRRD
ncbi:hypothetical protein LSUE1_G007967 [Lachnellula suecica]|uniref:Uncharacterized protein n=1 Tax=Lachnellula suecica TaxID=602035 RepID=A0A8T9C1L6_9HELO|nr:hypothetical protein LSUE1_G007967 [Lachnellula suecica]